MRAKFSAAAALSPHSRREWGLPTKGELPLELRGGKVAEGRGKNDRGCSPRGCNVRSFRARGTSVRARPPWRSAAGSRASHRDASRTIDFTASTSLHAYILARARVYTHSPTCTFTYTRAPCNARRTPHRSTATRLLYRAETSDEQSRPRSRRRESQGSHDRATIRTRRSIYPA